MRDYTIVGRKDKDGYGVECTNLIQIDYYKPNFYLNLPFYNFVHNNFGLNSK